LGSTFLGSGPRKVLVNLLVSFLYKKALAACDVVFFQNADDQAHFVRSRLVDSRKTILVPGSGVALNRFPQMPIPGSRPTFLLIARLIIEKGIRVYADAARRVKSLHPEARFQLLGPFDNHPGGIARREVAAWEAEGVLEYLGEVADVRPALAACTTYVLPSFYGEGRPRSTLEALATGRAIVTTDAPGCRETVVPGENGFLVPPGDVGALATAMARFLDDRSLAAKMGQRSRVLAEELYDVRMVNRMILEGMGLAGHDSGSAGCRDRIDPLLDSR
ncbi:MAG: glycosyltransferase family 4 protein, partial [Acidobacteriota bacterium]